MTRYHLFFIYGMLALCLAGIGFILLQKPTRDDATEPQFMDRQQGMSPIPLGSIRIFPIPDSLTFAGERVPLEKQDIFERLEREIYSIAYWQSNTVLLMKRSAKYLPEISQILQEQGVPGDFKYLAMAESGLANVTSPAGAKGFWQFMQGTARDFGLEVNRNVDERYHWQKSTFAATQYLNQAHKKFGNWTAVAASYNMGQAGFSRRQSEQLEEDYYQLLLNDETSRYIFRVLAYKVIFENPQDYGFNLRPRDYYQDPELEVLIVREGISNLATWAKSRGYSYKELKLYNPWMRGRNLNVRKGKPYQVLLPKKP